MTHEQSGDLAAGMIFQILAGDSVSSLVQEIRAAHPNLERHTVYGELILMLMFFMGQGIQATYPQPSIHRPIMDRMVERIHAFLVAPPGALDVNGAKQGFLNRGEADELVTWLALDSPTDSKVLSRFSLWASSAQMATVSPLALGSTFLKCLGIEGAALPFVKIQIPSLVSNTTVFVELLQQHGPQAARSPVPTSRQVQDPGRSGCVVVLLGFLMVAHFLL